MNVGASIGTFFRRKTYLNPQEFIFAAICCISIFVIRRGFCPAGTAPDHDHDGGRSDGTGD